MFTVIGGRPIGEVESLVISGVLPVTDECLQDNLDRAGSLGLPGIERVTPVRHLAVVGGGASIEDHIEDLQEWDGDVLAINGAYDWCLKHGIESTFFAVDPHPVLVKFCRNVETAILSTNCHPDVFDLLKDADVKAFDSGTEIKSGSCAASSTPWLAAHMGYSSVTLFGCECSYGESTHAYQNESWEDEIIIECGGQEFLTAPFFYRYAMEFKTIFRGLDEAVPGYLKERSGGLLRAVLENETHRVKWISESMAGSLQRC